MTLIIWPIRFCNFRVTFFLVLAKKEVLHCIGWSGIDQHGIYGLKIIKKMDCDCNSEINDDIFFLKKRSFK